jgi:hypothetical protein
MACITIMALYYIFPIWICIQPEDGVYIQNMSLMINYRVVNTLDLHLFSLQGQGSSCGDTHIAALLPPSVLCFTLRQRSLAASIFVLLPKRPFGAPASETTSAGHAYQLCHLTNGEANQRAELGIKEASFPSSSSSSPDQFSSSHQHWSSWHIRAVNAVRPRKVQPDRKHHQPDLPRSNLSMTTDGVRLPTVHHSSRYSSC